MKNLSVTTFIHILFLFALSILVTTYLLFLSWDKDRQKIEQYKRYQLISLTFLSNLQLKNSNKESMDKLYKELNVEDIEGKSLNRVKKEIENVGKTIFTGGSSIGRVKVFRVDKKEYIYVQRMGNSILLLDNKENNYYFEMAIALGIFLILLLLLIYFAVLKKLYPLKILHKQIQNFAKGDMQTRISYVYDDEIGKIAKSFNDAIVHINNLSRSKNLFMRNLMHELKTPITKGRIIVEMIDDDSTKKVLIRAFERMNELISELAEIERVTTQSFKPNFEHQMLSEIIFKSKNLLMSDSASIEVDIKDIALITDKKLMIIVIKNLIDNGIKYGKSKSVIVSNSNNIIKITSKGDKLEHPLTYYTEPFSQAEKRSSGFGLGLYIVDGILEKLGYKLDYEHKDGDNIFMLMPNPLKIQL